MPQLQDRVAEDEVDDPWPRKGAKGKPADLPEAFPVVLLDEELPVSPRDLWRLVMADARFFRRVQRAMQSSDLRLGRWQLGESARTACPAAAFSCCVRKRCPCPSGMGVSAERHTTCSAALPELSPSTGCTWELLSLENLAARVSLHSLRQHAHVLGCMNRTGVFSRRCRPTDACDRHPLACGRAEDNWANRRVRHVKPIRRQLTWV